MVLLGLLLGVGGGRGTALGQSTAARPNILIIVTDDQREGLEVMPQTRQFFQQGGTTYPNGIAVTPMCCPGRAEIMSGRYAHNNGVTRNSNANLLDQSRTIQAYLDGAGYRTAIFGKFFNSIPLSARPRFFDVWATFPNSQYNYVDGRWNVQGTVKSVPGYATDYLGNRSVNFIRANAGRPWYLYVATPNPHGPMTPQERYAEATVPPWDGNPAVFEEDRSDKSPWVQSHSQTFEGGREVRTRQLRTLMSVDDMVGRIMSTLVNTGQLANTLAFYVSDNGYHWSEHGLPGKGSPYLQSVRIPFLARWPGHLAAGATDARLVANVDIAPTALQAAGLSPRTPFDGRPLTSSVERERMLIEYWAGQQNGPPPWASRLTSRDQYIEFYDPTTGDVTFREYYDLSTDPWQLTNLSTPPAGVAAQLAADRVCAGISCP
jgi:arylsulfatase A-like enzyme